MFQLLYTYVASAYSKCFICIRHMMQVFYLDVSYVAVAIHICCKRMLQMFHLFQMYVLEVLHVVILVDAGSKYMWRRSPHERQAKWAWMVPTCIRISRHEAYNCCVDAPTCRDRCVGTKLHAEQMGQTFFWKRWDMLSSMGGRRADAGVRMGASVRTSEHKPHRL
jgi:hypothetical protein